MCTDGTETFTTYLLVDDGAACPDPGQVVVEDLNQLGCPCPAIQALVACDVAERDDTPLGGSGQELEGQDACGYVAVGESTGVCCGRPLLHAGAPVVASLGSAAWTLEADAPDLAGLSAAERALLAHYWREVALMEHASVASFRLTVKSFDAPEEKEVPLLSAWHLGPSRGMARPRSEPRRPGTGRSSVDSHGSRCS